MPRAPVFIKATFVLVKAGKTPTVAIDCPDDITELVDDIDVKGYDLLVYRIANIVKTRRTGSVFKKTSNTPITLIHLRCQMGASTG